MSPITQFRCRVCGTLFDRTAARLTADAAVQCPDCLADAPIQLETVTREVMPPVSRLAAQPVMGGAR